MSYYASASVFARLSPRANSRASTLRKLRQATRPVVEVVEPRQLLAGFPDTVGTEFWVAFEPNKNIYAKKVLFLSSETDATVTISIPGLATPFTNTYTVTPGIVTEVSDIPDIAFNDATDGTQPLGIHITTASPDQEIAVLGMNNEDKSADGFTALPVDVLGTRYRTLNYLPNPNNPEWPSQFAVVGTQDNTVLTITPSVDAGVAGSLRPAGVPFNVTINTGDVYQLQAFNADLTGSLIESDKPVAVFSGARRTSVPSTTAWASSDHLVEQLTPEDSWGSYFVTVPFGDRVGDTYRVLASADNTEIRISGNLVSTINTGECYEWIAYESQVIVTSEPTLVAQYANNTQFDGKPGDQFMLLIPPARNVLQSYTLSTAKASDGGPWKGVSYLNLWASYGTDVYLDGVLIPTDSWTPFGNGGYVGLNQQIPAGSHTITGSAPFGVVFYGWDTSYAYGYLGGSTIGQAIAPVTTLTFDEPVAEDILGNSHMIVVTATDAEGNPVPGAQVDFTVEGANFTSDYAITDVNGQATFSYGGTYYGLDTITATSGNVFSGASLEWHTVPVVTNQVITIAYDTQATGSVGVTNGDVHVPVLSLLTLPTNGVLEFNGDGSFIYTPNSGFSGQDLFTYVATDSIAVSDVGTIRFVVTPLNHAPAIADQTFNLIENAPMATVVGKVVATDQDLNALTYSITGGNTDGLFKIAAASGLISVAKDAVIDFEAGLPDYVLTVQVRDNGNPMLSASANITIHVTDLNESPTGLALTGSTVAENLPAGTPVGTFSSTDPDAGETFTYQLVAGVGSGQNSFFQIVGNALQTATPLNFEARSSYSIRVRTTDHGGKWAEQTFTITATNVNESPSIAAIPNAALSEGNTFYYMAKGSDPEATPITYSLATGSPAGMTISPTTGEIFWAPGESQCPNLYTVTVIASDGELPASASFFLTTTEVNAIPTIDPIAMQSLKLGETLTFTATASDTDIPANKLAFSLVGAPSGATINATTGVFTWTPTIYAMTGIYTFQVQVRDNGTPSLWAAQSVQVTLDHPVTPLPLVIRGTEGADSIRVTAEGSLYMIVGSGPVSFVEAANVGSITIEALGGNDKVEVGPGVMAASIVGGTGDDSVIGGDGNDTVYGGDGNDTVSGNGGNDWLLGNFGNDLIDGGVGMDQIQGGLGSDTLRGGTDDDSLIGGDQSDVLYGDGGNDYLEGKGKPDTLYGGAGNDTIIGGAGVDMIYGEDGDDTLDALDTFFVDFVFGGDGVNTILSDEMDILA